jgi:adenine-specific DNA-methyltransferase
MYGPSTFMKYIGSKTKLLDFIDEALKSSGITRIESFVDVFAGTGAVAAHVAKKYRPGRILLNDLQYYSYVLCRARFEGPKHGPLLETIVPRHGFFSEHYAGMYFTKENARRIDGWLAAIRPDDFYAKACLLDAVTKVSNTACVYENYLKNMSRRALSALVVRPVECIRFPGKIEYFNQRAEDFVPLVPDRVHDVVYLDPPYNGRKYATNYHILETIARNDRPDLRCKAKIRADATLSAFNSRRKVREVLGTVLDNWKSRCRHLCMSYNSEGIVSKEDIVTMLKQRGYGDVRVYEKEYPRFSTHASDKTKTVFEYVFVASGT